MGAYYGKAWLSVTDLPTEFRAKMNAPLVLLGIGIFAGEYD